MEYRRHWLKPDLPYDIIRLDSTGLAFLKKGEVRGFYLWGDIHSATLKRYYVPSRRGGRFFEDSILIGMGEDVSYRIKFRGFLPDITDGRNFIKEIGEHISLTESTNYIRWAVQWALGTLAVIAVCLAISPWIPN